MQERALALLGPVLAACLVSAGVVACDESFEPLAPSDVRLSVFGYLDASADTQWLRVMPIRPVMLTSPDSFGITVTLEHMGTGHVIPLQDSLFRFFAPQHPELGSEGVWLHNFWTVEPIEPGATYRFSAAFSGTEPAEAVVEIPPEYQVEVWLRQTRYETDYVGLAGIQHVPFLTSIAHFHDACGPGVDSVWYDVESADEGMHMVPVSPAPAVARYACGPPTLDRQDLWIVGSASPWPEGDAYSPTGLGGTPERVSNVSNAVGFIGGVLTRKIPYESCSFQGGGPTPDHCRLRYGPGSATVTGTVRETRCGDGVLDSVTVELRELDGEPAAERRVRTTLTNPAGVFEIQALEPGLRYALKARAKPVPDPFWGEIDNYTLHYDTLTFTPGERLEYPIGLERLTDCGLAP